MHFKRGSLKVSSGFIAAVLFSLPISAMAQDDSPIGKTILAVGQVKAVGGETERRIRRRSPVYQVDTITTAPKSQAQFSMVDGGLITLKENSELLISGYQTGVTPSDNSATLELVRGGLRSISGSIKKQGGDYKVNTPVGTIGIRGTHFQIELSGDDVLFAVWDGDIDVALNNNEILSLGVSENFAFARVSSNGQVTPLLTPPAGINAGFDATSAEDEQAENDEEESDADSEGDSQVASQPADESNSDDESDANAEDGEVAENELETTAPTDFDDDTGETTTTEVVANNDNDDDADFDTELETSLIQDDIWQGTDETPLAELLTQRQGVVNYNDVTSSLVTSTNGTVENFDMEMVVDFDNGAIPTGFVSFDDDGGAWFATFAGLIKVDQIDIDVTFASHGDKDADGDINAAFLNGLDDIAGNFELFEIDDPNVRTNGSFVIKP